MRKTKIVCTLGPSVDDEEVLEKLFLKGMNVARLNFSHGTHEEHAVRIERFKRVRSSLNMTVPLLLDSKGPEIRTGKFGKGEVELAQGQDFIFCHEDRPGDENGVSVSYKQLYQDIARGNRILVNDGLVEFEVEEIRGKDIHCRVLNGGVIGNNKSMNLPGVDVNLPAITEKDIADIRFGIEHEFDFVAASFVRKASDVLQIKSILEKNGGSGIKVIAKIENHSGVNNIDEILKVADGIMVARGDLGVEIPFEDVPVVQKNLIQKCYLNGKPVITATQMLDSMIRNPRPTRAETSDVANAIYDGTSAIMLSGETAAGKYPVESLEMMGKIAERAEGSIDYWKRFSSDHYNMMSNVTNAISHATYTTAQDLKAAAIITVTQSGHTARMVSRFRPSCPIIATTIDARVQRQLSLSWGVLPFLVSRANTTDEMFDMGVEKALMSGLVKDGDLVVITAGVPIGISGTTNILKVHVVGKVLIKGTGIGSGALTATACVAKSLEEMRESFQEGNILVTTRTDNEMLPFMKQASAVIVEEEGIGNHAATVGLALEIPVIVGAENATQILKNGSVITLDSIRGIVYYGETKV